MKILSLNQVLGGSTSEDQKDYMESLSSKEPVHLSEQLTYSFIFLNSNLILQICIHPFYVSGLFILLRLINQLQQDDKIAEFWEYMSDFPLSMSFDESTLLLDILKRIEKGLFIVYRHSVKPQTQFIKEFILPNNTRRIIKLSKRFLFIMHA